MRGLIGRAAIAVEPVLCGTVFAALTAGLILRRDDANVNDLVPYIAPMFGLAVVFCIFWAIGIMFAPVRAYAHTYAPIFIVDGYVRSRAPDHEAEIDQSGYFAVLDESRRVVAEWPIFGPTPLHDRTTPALVEFSRYGGIHRIDGQNTGIVPDALRPLGVGETRPR